MITLSVTEEVQRMDYNNSAWITTATQRFKRAEGEIRRKGAGNVYPIFFVSFQSTVQKVTRHFFVFIQPLDDKWLKPPTGSNNLDICNLNSSISKIYSRILFHRMRLFLQNKTLLTQDIQALCSWRRAGPCSTRCTATWPWSAGSCNLHSCTGGFFHALWKGENTYFRDCLGGQHFLQVCYAQRNWKTDTLQIIL